MHNKMTTNDDVFDNDNVELVDIHELSIDDAIVEYLEDLTSDTEHWED